ncbi:hypothetical protein AcW1_006023 [Taiwanofungus camphoratus]|nr:hypothetical protein AcV5_006341 [Antrodia cinnamomea]KAI0950183.1 hypothetical protein AcV7_008729 [Antrodia cinnamomea]KAI0957723.1 hypothetical protein AcW1_006023 [Antrodia cinnamomea]
MRASTLATLAVAAAASTALPSALAAPQIGSDAISLSTVDDGVKLVTAAANAVPAVKSAWNDVFGRELEDLSAREPAAHRHHKLKQGSKAHAARDDGSDAISLSTIDDGVKLVTGAENAVPAIKSAWDDVFGRELGDLMAREPSAHRHYKLKQASKAHGARDDGSDAISLSTIDSGVKIFTDAANAVPAIKNAWNSVFRRELEDLLARKPRAHRHHKLKQGAQAHAAREDGSDAISLSTIDSGVKIFTDAANAVPAVKNAWDSVFGRELDALLAREPSPKSTRHRMHRTKGHSARAPITESEVDTGLKVAADAFNAVPAVKNAWDSVFHRRFLDELD